jgi:hypothetical protein
MNRLEIHANPASRGEGVFARLKAASGNVRTLAEVSAGLAAITVFAAYDVYGEPPKQRLFGRDGKINQEIARMASDRLARKQATGRVRSPGSQSTPVPETPSRGFRVPKISRPSIPKITGRDGAVNQSAARWATRKAARQKELDEQLRTVGSQGAPVRRQDIKYADKSGGHTPRLGTKGKLGVRNIKKP